MIPPGNKTPKIIILFATAHIIQGISIWISKSALHITSLQWLNDSVGTMNMIPPILNQIVAGSILIGVALLSLAGLYSKLPKIPNILLFLPQQIVLFLSSYSAFQCVLNQAYADGVKRDFFFIFPDQITFILVAGFFTAAVLDFCTHKRING